MLMASPDGAPNPMGTWFMIFAFIGIFYFLLIRPQRRQQKEHEEMVKQLKKGDEVVTIGGIVGTIVHIQDDRVTIKSAETRLDIERSKVSHVSSGG
jgi:preprotein translocase subunit YajC